MSSNLNKIKFLDSLSIYLTYAKNAHSNYIINNKKFVYTKIIYSTNQKIKNLITDEILSLDKKEREYALDLLFHIEVWQVIWETEQKKKNPDWNEVFDFKYEDKFPKESVRRLFSHENDANS